MKIYLNFVLILTTISLIRSHTHDENSKCALTGVHKTRQTILESPNYPNNYPPDTCWDYVIRSPYRCPTKYHIQFLDFYLEASKNCENDYLSVGLNNVDDDMDTLCGQVVGIKKYHTPDGVLRLRFLADDSPWSTGKGFKLLVTRLACEKEELLRELPADDDDDNDDTIAITAPTGMLEPPNSEILEIFRNLSGQEQHQVYPLPPLFGLNYPTQLPSPPYPGLGGLYLPNNDVRGPIPNYPGYNVQNILEKPCNDNKQQQSYVPNYVGNLNGIQQQSYLPSYPASNQLQQQSSYGGNNGYLPTSRDQYSGAINGNQQQSNLPSYPNSNQLQPPSYGTNNAYLPSYPGSNQLQPPSYGTNNAYLPSYPGSNQLQPPQSYGVNNAYLPTSRDQYIGSWSSSSSLRAFEGSSPSLEACCTSGFQQKRFYLSSPGFPRTIFSNILPNAEKRDCEFQIQKSSPNVCRLRLEFKFFDFGQNYQGTGSYQGNIGFPSIESSKNTCTDDYIEIDNQRFCGCRSNYVYNAFWNDNANKKLRMRMGYSGIPSGGFLLELTQEECSETQFSTTTPRPTTKPSPATTRNPNMNQNPNFINQLQPLGFLNQLQQQQNIYGGGGGSYQNGNYQGLQQQPFIQNPIQQPPNFLGPQLIGNLAYPPQNQQNQQQLPIQSTPIYQPYPSQFNTNYLPSFSHDYNHNQIQQQPFARYARSFNDQPTPVTIVETNSTRKEYYFTDSDSTNLNDDSTLGVAMSRSSNIDSSSRWVEEEYRANNNLESNGGNKATERRKCSFDMADILRLSVDILWLTKPTCYAPQRNWFTNWIG